LLRFCRSLRDRPSIGAALCTTLVALPPRVRRTCLDFSLPEVLSASSVPVVSFSTVVSITEAGTVSTVSRSPAWVFWIISECSCINSVAQPLLFIPEGAVQRQKFCRENRIVPCSLKKNHLRCRRFYLFVVGAACCASKKNDAATTRQLVHMQRFFLLYFVT
jgi:hypothetical protein